MALNDVKELTVPVNGTDKAVKMIQDSNGNIIWGSQSAFPYRRLEYIHFSGAESINTGVQLPTGNSYKRIDMYTRYNNNSNWGSHGFYSTGSNRFLLGVNGSGKTQVAVGNTYAYNSADLISIDNSTWYHWLLWSNNGSSNLGIYSDPGETSLVGTTNTRSYNFTSASGDLYIGAYNNNGSITGYCDADVANFAIRTGSYSNAVFNGIPCQRKSDGVCGMYDLITQTFKPMTGTVITDNAAGPVVDEYWDLTI